MMVTEIKGFGAQSGTPRSTAAPNTPVAFVPKVKLEIVVPDAGRAGRVDQSRGPRAPTRSATARSSSWT
jgi:nitrogen regulatory protein PII